MVNVLYVPFAPSVAVYRKICAFSKLSKRGLTLPSVNCRLFALEVIRSGTYFERFLLRRENASRFPFFSLYLLREIRYFTI